MLTANLVRGNITVYVNGKMVGSFTNGVVPLDISNYVKSGQNTLRVAWKKGDTLPLGYARVSYAASAKQFRQIAQFDMTLFTKAKEDKSVTFNLP